MRARVLRRPTFLSPRGFSVPPLPVESSLPPAFDESESAAPSGVFESEGLSVPQPARRVLSVPPDPLDEPPR